MAVMEYLEEKLSKAEEKVTKCKGTIERHKKQMDKKIQKLIKDAGIDTTGMERQELDKLSYENREHASDIYDVKRKLEDIKGATSKLEDAERIAKNWKEKLDTELDKASFIAGEAPQIIIDFVQNWKDLAFSWNVDRYEKYQDFKKKLDEDEKNAHKELGISTIMHPNKEQKEKLKEMRLDYRSIKERRAAYAGQLVLRMDSIYDEEKRLDMLEKTLEKERQAKLLFLVHKIHGRVGRIKDATGLKLTAGDINGIVIGEDGKVRVKTISAGGYNIQVFHYRVLIQEA